MARVELEQITDPYEFEDRGNQFMMDVATIAINDFEDLLVEIENKTLGDLEANRWACKKSIENNKDRMYKKAFERGLDTDRLSATETTVMISIHGAKRKRIDHFRGQVAACAKKYWGKKTGEESDCNYADADYKYFTFVNYTFRG